MQRLFENDYLSVKRPASKVDLIQLKFEIYFIQGDKKKGSDISVLLLPSGNGERKKLAACI